MAILSAFRALFESSAADLVVKAAKSVISQMQWAKDPKKTQYIERKIALLVSSASELARNLAPGTVDPQIDRLLSDFSEDLVEEGISSSDAALITESVRAQIRSTILQPLDDLIAVQKRLESLEKESLDLERKLNELKDRVSVAEPSREEVYRLRTVAWIAAVVGTIALILALRPNFH